MCSLTHLSTCPQSHMVTYTCILMNTVSLSHTITHMHILIKLHTHSHNHNHTHAHNHTHIQYHTRDYVRSVTHTASYIHRHTVTHTWEYNYTHENPQWHTHMWSHIHAQSITHASLMHMHTHIPHTVTYWKPHMAVSAVHTMAWKSDPLGALGLESESFVSLLCCLSVDYSRRNEGPTSSGLVANIDKGEIQSKSLIIEKSRKPHSEHLCCFYLVSSNTMLRGLSSSKV